MLDKVGEYQGNFTDDEMRGAEGEIHFSKGNPGKESCNYITQSVEYVFTCILCVAASLAHAVSDETCLTSGSEPTTQSGAQTAF